MKNPTPPTVAVLCDAQGIVTSVIRDDLGLQDRLVPGRPFPLAVDGHSFRKALHFLEHIKAHGTAFDWTLNIPAGPENEIATLYFVGARLEENLLLIIGARNGGEARRALDELMRINNEQANALRSNLKTQRDMLRRAAERDAALYEELMRVNNELANLQRELVKKNAELARLNELKSQFLAMAAHDLHHPIGVIQMYGEFLLDEAASALSAEHGEFLKIIVDSSRTMQQILNDFLDIAKIEAGRLELHPVPTNLEDLVRRSVALNQLGASKKDIRLVFDSRVSNLVIEVDPPKMEQVLNNLLSNAVKFSPPGSFVHVSLWKENHAVKISVSDQGMGIPRDKTARLFQPFERIRTGGSSVEKGSGLGLAIAKKILEAHGAEIHVASEEGKGSTFTVTLPVGA